MQLKNKERIYVYLPLKTLPYTAHQSKLKQYLETQKLLQQEANSDKDSLLEIERNSRCDPHKRSDLYWGLSFGVFLSLLAEKTRETFMRNKGIKYIGKARKLGIKEGLAIHLKTMIFIKMK